MEDEKEETQTSDVFLFHSSKQDIDNAKKVIKTYNNSHEDNKLIIKVYHKDDITKFFVIGDANGRSQVKNLIRGVGGKYQAP